MKIKYLSLLALLSLAMILLSSRYFLLIYWSAMIISLFYLNLNKKYRYQPNVSYYNSFFLTYLFAVIIDRIRWIRFNEMTEFVINSAMHITFACIVCFKISQYLFVFGIKSRYRMFYIALIFNVLGIINECMQNLISQRPISIFIPDAQKDILMNLIGTFIFISAEYLWYNKKGSISK